MRSASDASNTIVFPQGSAHAGEFDLNGKEVYDSNIAARCEGNDCRPSWSAQPSLMPDTSEPSPRVEMGTLRLSRDRARRTVNSRADTDSEAARNFQGMVFFFLSTLNYRVTADLASR